MSKMQIPGTIFIHHKELLFCGWSHRLAELQGQLRPLDTHVLRLLGHVQATALPQAALAPAAFLLEQLQGQLVEALTRARRPAFLNSAAFPDTSAGKSPACCQQWCISSSCHLLPPSGRLCQNMFWCWVPYPCHRCSPTSRAAQRYAHRLLLVCAQNNTARHF